jgi:hypothetical protein
MMGVGSFPLAPLPFPKRGKKFPLQAVGCILFDPVENANGSNLNSRDAMIKTGNFAQIIA